MANKVKYNLGFNSALRTIENVIVRLAIKFATKIV